MDAHACLPPTHNYQVERNSCALLKSRLETATGQTAKDIVNAVEASVKEMERLNRLLGKAMSKKAARTDALFRAHSAAFMAEATVRKLRVR